MLLTVVLVRGIRESAETNNIMVLIKIAAILIFVSVGASFIQPHYYHPFSAQRLVRRPYRRLHHFLHLHWLRFRLHRRGRVQKSAA